MLVPPRDPAALAAALRRLLADDRRRAATGPRRRRAVPRAATPGTAWRPSTEAVYRRLGAAGAAVTAPVDSALGTRPSDEHSVATLRTHLAELAHGASGAASGRPT